MTRLLAIGLVAGGLAVAASAVAPQQAQALPAGVVPISSGGLHSCAITSVGGLRCWGLNTNGRLGDGTSTGSGPVAVSGLSSGVTAVSASSDAFTCAVVSGGARCWGVNSSGQLGNSTTVASLVPVNVTGLGTGVSTISAGGSHGCALLTTGGLKCWGQGAFGQLGRGSTSSSSTAVDVTGLGSGVAAVSAGQNSTCAVTTGGAAKCWGLNNTGQLGTNATSTSSVPASVTGLTSGVASISAGISHACVVTTSGGVKCWGANDSGQLGNGTTTTSLVPVDVDGLSSGVTAVSAGASHSCALLSSGSVRCWGLGTKGQLGNRTLTSSSVPVTVSSLTDATAISAGGEAATSQTCALRTSGEVSCWGSESGGATNTRGELGNGTHVNSNVPVQVVGLSADVVSLHAGTNHTCVRTSAGSTRCWGYNSNGQLGNGTTSYSSQAIDLGAAGADLSSVGGGGTHTCAVTSTGGAVCWGNNAAGQVGNGTTDPTLVPAAVTGLASGVTSTTGGLLHSCALVSGGGVKCWGSGSFGRLGTGTTDSSLVPVDVVGLSSGVSQLDAGSEHTCAVTTGGGVKCWGRNDQGQLGNNSTTDSSSPVDVVGLTSGVASVSAGSTHTCAVLTGGGAKCWGNNFDGRLGNGSTTRSLVPVDVTGLSSGVAEVRAGGSNSCARTTAGGVKCWGLGISGQLGRGSNLSSSVPVDVSGLTSGVQSIDIGAQHGCALLGSGSVRCWGATSQGQIGNGIWGITDPVIGGAIFYVTPNSAPVAASSSLAAPRGIGTHIVLAATDADAADVLHYEVASQPSKGTLDCNGSFGEDCVYTAGPGQTGSDSFTFTANDGSVDSNVATVTITITNQAPVADAIVSSAPRGVATEVILTGSDPNSDPVTFSTATDPLKGTVSCSTGGICAYTASPGTSGDDSFTVTANDGVLTSAPATVTIHITNQAPTADARAIEAGRGIPTPIVLSGIDPNSDPLTFAVMDEPAKGSVICNPSGSSACTYTSDRAATGSDSFTYSANDGDLGSVPVTVSVSLVNAGPTANDQALSVPRGVATPIVLSGADGEGDALAFAVVDQPAHGILACAGPSGSDCSYTAGVGATGTDSFTFTTSDGSAASSAATVSITITNQAPVANAQTVAGNAPTTATPITLGGSDPNGDALTYEKLTSPTKGSLSCTGDSCSYTAAAGRTGVDSFTFEVTDIGGLTSTATVKINLDNVTPGVYVGRIDAVEPESGNASYRAPFVPVTLSTPAASPVTVWYYTVDGTAVTTGLGGDYRSWGTPSSPRSITIPAGQSTGWIQPPVFDDDLIEGDEQFGVVISSLTGGASYLGAAATTVTIVDADTISVGKPILTVTDLRQAEGNVGTRTVGFRVELSKVAAEPVAMTCTPTAGSALAGVDFKAGAKTITIAAGSLSKTVDILVYANTVAQGDRTFTLNCVPSGAPDVTVFKAAAADTIVDDD